MGFGHNKKNSVLEFMYQLIFHSSQPVVGSEPSVLKENNYKMRKKGKGMGFCLVGSLGRPQCSGEERVDRPEGVQVGMGRRGTRLAEI